MCELPQSKVKNAVQLNQPQYTGLEGKFQHGLQNESGARVPFIDVASRVNRKRTSVSITSPHSPGARAHVLNVVPAPAPPSPASQPLPTKRPVKDTVMLLYMAVILYSSILLP